MEKVIKVQSMFGHEIMALLFAKSLSMTVLIIPNKDNKEEFEEEAVKIYDNLSFFYKNIKLIPFEEKEKYEQVSWDVISELKSGKLSDEIWNTFASTKLTPCKSTSDLPKFESLDNLSGTPNILVVPQKLISDGECGVSAAQQSVNPNVFNFLKTEDARLVLGQHFNKVADLNMVKALAEDFQMYVPGMTEDEEVFGIRGVRHSLYYNMYKKLSCSVGIAGTHTWYMLTMFPEIPQVILYNKNGVENWEAIAAAERKAGREIYVIGFDEHTDMVELSKQVEEAFFYLLFRTVLSNVD